MSSSPSKSCAVTLSIVVPCFNEAPTLGKCVERLLDIEDAALSLEIIIVDDKSLDGSLDIALDLAKKHPGIRVVPHDRNRGKGAALQTGFRLARGAIVGIQDADLEYHPRDLKGLIEPILMGEADVVLGSRFFCDDRHQGPFPLHYEGNRVLTLFSNLFTGLNLSDMETCYKVFRREILDHLVLREERFGFEPEFVAKVARMGLRVLDKPITSYDGRSHAEGKKIRWRDGLRALYCIVRYGRFGRRDRRMRLLPRHE